MRVGVSDVDVHYPVLEPSRESCGQTSNFSFAGTESSLVKAWRCRTPTRSSRRRFRALDDKRDDRDGRVAELLDEEEDNVAALALTSELAVADISGVGTPLRFTEL